MPSDILEKILGPTTDVPAKEEPSKKPASRYQNSWKSERPFQWSPGIVRGPGKWIGRNIYPDAATAEKFGNRILKHWSEMESPVPGVTAAEFLGLQYLGPVPLDD